MPVASPRRRAANRCRGLTPKWSVENDEILCRRFAVPARHELILDLLAFTQGGETRPLDRRDVNESITGALIGGDEAVSFAGLNHFTVPVAISYSIHLVSI